MGRWKIDKNWKPKKIILHPCHTSSCQPRIGSKTKQWSKPFSSSKCHVKEIRAAWVCVQKRARKASHGCCLKKFRVRAHPETRFVTPNVEFRRWMSTHHILQFCADGSQLPFQELNGREHFRSHRSVMTLATFIAFGYKCLAEECLVAQPQKQSKQMVRIRNNRIRNLGAFKNFMWFPVNDYSRRKCPKSSQICYAIDCGTSFWTSPNLW